MRRDARERRDHIVAVAADLFEQEGYEIPLEAIAEKAGVGRGTLYRNFRDRSALILEVLRLRIAELLRGIEAIDDPLEAFLSLLRRGAILAALHSPGASLMERDPDFREQWLAFDQETKKAIQPPLDRAIAAGRIRPDLTVDDLMLISHMLGAAGQGHVGAERDRIIATAADLIFTGLQRRSQPAATAV